MYKDAYKSINPSLIKMVKRRRTKRRGSFRKRRRLNQLYRPVGKSTELKSVDIAFGQNFTIAGTLIFLNQIRLGSDMPNRIGRKISLKSLNLRLGIAAVDNTNAQTRLRIMVIYDKQTNGAATAFADVVAGFTAASAVTNDTWDGINLNNRERYIVYRDWMKFMPNNVAGAVGGPFNPSMYECIWSNFVNLRNVKTIYSTDAAAITEVNTGALFILIESTVDNEFALTGTARLRFTDD